MGADLIRAMFDLAKPDIECNSVQKSPLTLPLCSVFRIHHVAKLALAPVLRQSRTSACGSMPIPRCLSHNLGAEATVKENASSDTI